MDEEGDYTTEYEIPYNPSSRTECFLSNVVTNDDIIDNQSLLTSMEEVECFNMLPNVSNIYFNMCSLTLKANLENDLVANRNTTTTSSPMSTTTSAKVTVNPENVPINSIANLSVDPLHTTATTQDFSSAKVNQDFPSDNRMLKSSEYSPKTSRDNILTTPCNSPSSRKSWKQKDRNSSWKNESDVVNEDNNSSNPVGTYSLIKATKEDIFHRSENPATVDKKFSIDFEKVEPGV